MPMHRAVQFQTVDDGLTLEYRYSRLGHWRKFASYDDGATTGRMLQLLLTSDYAFNAHFRDAIGARRELVIHD